MPDECERFPIELHIQNTALIVPPQVTDKTTVTTPTQIIIWRTDHLLVRKKKNVIILMF